MARPKQPRTGSPHPRQPRQLGGLYLRQAQLDGRSPQALARLLLNGVEHQANAALAHVTDIIPAYESVYLEYDRGQVSETGLKRAVAGLMEAAGTRASGEDGERPGSLKEIPVTFDGADLGAVAERCGLAVEAVVREFVAVDYEVAAVGFSPGFPFLAGVAPHLRVPRRSTPRASVPAHSVAIANHQAGIYPLASPGGWNLLGTALKAVYDPHREPPFLLSPGDRVRFLAAQGEPPPEPSPLRLMPLEPVLPAFEVVQPGLLDLVVDEGRTMAGRFGLVRGGALDAPLARLANRLVGNRPDAPLLELTLTGPKLEVLSDSVIAVAGDSLLPRLSGAGASASLPPGRRGAPGGESVEPYRSFLARRGQLLAFTPTSQGCRSYLAVAGGLEMGRFMASASVDLRGLIGRALAAGDLLGREPTLAPAPGRSFRPHRRVADPVTVRLLPGPQASNAALEALTADGYRVGRADRTGAHLAGPEVPGGEVTSEATPLGAVQITPSGTPIVLLNDRGTIGGYHKPAIVHPADLPLVAQLRPGGRLRFVVAAGRSR